MADLSIRGVDVAPGRQMVVREASSSRQAPQTGIERREPPRAEPVARAAAPREVETAGVRSAHWDDVVRR